MAESTCNADTKANALFTSLTVGVAVPPTFDFTDAKYVFVPDSGSPLYDTVADLGINDLTTVALDGTGVFDKLMASVDLHIQREFKSGRITGDQYAEVYMGVMNGVLSNSVQFLLTKDQSKFSAIEAQMKARIAEISVVTATVNLDIAKIEASKLVFDMNNSAAQYALTKINIANANEENCLIISKADNEKYKGCFILPAELKILEYQRMQVLPTNVDIAKYSLNIDLPIGSNILKEQLEKEHAQTNDTKIDGTSPIGGIIGVQTALLTEQQQAERAKTLDTRIDGITLITGSIGKQKDLYTQQIDSFVKDAKYKTAKMYLDGWITQKTLDDALLAPSELQNAEIDLVLSSIREANELGTPVAP